ncbi:MAG: LytTR family transcriptional regulator DNA-binding domain-containing protein [Oscillospiraceae bacterium]|nr:LytTR family transcriptional regulator DNA-binding domain-containing protein [Oscillospiraceae bacterium]
MLNAINKPTDSEMEKKLSFQRRGRVISLCESEILYLESDKHYVNIYTTDGESHSVQGKLSDFEGSLSDMFVKCHKSFVVNMNHIKRIDADGIKLLNNKPIPVSRSFSGQVKSRFLNFLEKK